MAKKVKMRRYKLGMRAFDFLVGLILLLIGLNSLLFPSATVWFFFAGVLFRGLFGIAKYIIKRENIWDLYFGVFSFVLAISVLLADVFGNLFDIIPFEIALASWAFAWGLTKAIRATDKKRTEPKKYIGHVVSGVLIMLLACALLVGRFATDSFIDMKGTISGITFIILGTVSIITALNWNKKRVPK
jgi:hypothetical protein